MTDQADIKDIAREVLDVLEHFDDSFVSKIPEGIIQSFQKISEGSTKKVEIDTSKKLSEQAISQEAKDFIAILYYEYFADPNEKKEIISIWKENEKL